MAKCDSAPFRSPPIEGRKSFLPAWERWFSSLVMFINGTTTKDIESSGNPARGTAAPVQVYLNNVSGWKFAVGDNFYYNFMVPVDWVTDSDITCELHWYSSNTTAARYIQWQIDWQATAIGEVITAPGSSGTLTSGDITLSTTANTLAQTTFSIIAGTSLAATDHVFLKISRIASTGTAPAIGDNPVWVHAEFEYTAYRAGI